MKKLLFLLLIIPALSFGQGRIWQKCGMYTTPPSGFATNRDILSDTCGAKNYKWTGTVWVENLGLKKSLGGSQGIQGPIGPQGIQGQSGPTGATGPVGPKGDPGVCPPCSGTGSSQSIYHIIANGTDQAWEVQRAVDSAYVTGRKILIDGKVKFSKGIKVQKDHRYLNIEGSGEIQALNTNEWTFFYSDRPASVVEAESVYAFRKIDFENIVLKGLDNKQSGFDLHSTEGMRIEHTWCYDLDTAYNFTFSLRTVDDQCEANNCNVAYIKQSGAGLYANATTSNACSNGGTTRDFRVYGKRDGYGMITKDVSGQKYDGITLEGDTTITMFEYNNTSGTSTALDMTRVHVEGMSRIASIKLRSGTATNVIDRPNFIKHNQVFILTEAASGYPNLTISNVSNQRVYFNNTPVFQSGAGTTWKFDNCDIPLRTENVPLLFKGSIPSIGCGIGAGANTICIENPINR
jgi:hypothetical protein